ncbi:MAG: 5'-nucleotidase C-terminal domain-containing protein [Bacteroidia bacterium]
MKSIFKHTYIWILAVALSACTTITQVQLTDKKTSQIAVNNTIAEDAETAAFIKPYKDSLDKIMNRVLAVSAKRMDKGQPESMLGNFVSDLILEYVNKETCKDPGKCSGAQMAFFNNGGFRNSLPQGNITVQHVYELMPFDNELVILEMPGRQVNELMKYIAQSGGIPVAGIKMKIKNNFPQDIYIGKEKFDSTKTYKVITSDYLANGGDKFFFLQHESVKRINLDIKLRDFLLQYIPEKAKIQNPLKAEKDGRITIVE